jgi:hypothetical protein
MARIALALFVAIPMAALTYFSVAQEKSEHHGDHDACAKACLACQKECDTCASHCAKLVESGKKEHAMTQHTCEDCSAICAAAAKIVARKGPFSEVICHACAEACKRCGDECAKHSSDATMKKCADECKKCEKACREMITTSPHATK